MGFDGVEADVEEVSDLFVGEALADEGEDLLFALREDVHRIWFGTNVGIGVLRRVRRRCGWAMRGDAAELVHHQRRHFGGERSFSPRR